MSGLKAEHGRELNRAIRRRAHFDHLENSPFSFERVDPKVNDDRHRMGDLFPDCVHPDLPLSPAEKELEARERVPGALRMNRGHARMSRGADIDK